jgi:hypothetical protein
MLQSRNSVMRGASGALGDELVFRQRAGRTVISLPAARRADNPTEEQLAYRERFRQSIIYARTAIADPGRKAIYQAIAEQGASAFNMAFRDRFKAPVITGIDIGNYSGSPGDLIRVGAVDDFRVETVRVTILNAAGTVMEEGPAVVSPEGTWMYTATVANATPAGGKMVVEASDLAGNVTKEELVL